ncbi:MAG: DUF11 domain-containing protein [Acidimicrobiia bacterium]|nr:DUF11 domain-containing protein [Acidimicrobiia bacterium]
MTVATPATTTTTTTTTTVAPTTTTVPGATTTVAPTTTTVPGATTTTVPGATTTTVPGATTTVAPTTTTVAPTTSSSSVVPVYDLALVKLLVSEGPFMAGGEVEFSLLVRNQGDVTANLIEVTDTLPAGMSLADGNAGWVASSDGRSAVFTSTDALAPGETLTVPLVLVLDDASLGAYANVAGISDDDGDDKDSSTGPGTDDPVVDQTDGSGLDVDQVPGDEDDSDIAVFTVPPASIGDRVWSDLDGDGIQDDNEPGVPGITVILEKVVDGVQIEVASTVT